MSLNLNTTEGQDHASFDAGLLSAAINTSQTLMQQFSSGEESFDTEAIRAWHVPWCVVPSEEESRPSLADFRNHTVSRLTEQLQKEEMLRGKPSRDIQIFIRHWAHLLLRESVYLHGQTKFQEAAPSAATPAIMFERLRLVLRNIAFTGKPNTNTHIIAESPAHPEWENYKAIESKSKRGSVIRLLNVSSDVRNMAKNLLGTNINPTTNINDPSCVIVQNALPELLTIDRGLITEIDNPERKAIQEFLAQRPLNDHPSNDELVRITDLIGDLLVSIDTDTIFAQILAEQITKQEGRNAPDIADASVDDILKTYIDPAMHHENMTTSLAQRLPILRAQKDRAAQALENMYKNGAVTDRLMELYILALNASIGENVLLNMRGTF
jgi:hypothetical protein